MARCTYGALVLMLCGQTGAAAAQAAEPHDADPNGAPAEATDDAPADHPDVVDVVVTAKRKGEDPFVADRAVSVVGAKQLRERQARTAPEALWDAPGVFVQQTSHGGGSPIVRGLIGPQVLLLLDGVRLNNSVYRTGPLQYLNLIDPLSTSRIEVLRGPGSVLYGSDAMGGVIQIFPHEPRDTRHLREVEAHGGSQLRYASAGKSLSSHAEVELGRRGMGALAGGTLRSLGDLRGGRGVGVQLHSGYAAQSALGSLDYRFADGGPLGGLRNKATYYFSGIDGAGRTDKLYDKRSLQVYDNDLHVVYDRLRFEVDALSTAIELTPSFQSFFERRDTIDVASDLSTPLSTVRDETEVNTLGLDGQLDTTLVDDRLSLRYGGMFYRDWVDAQRIDRAGQRWLRRADQAYPSGSSYSHFGAFVLAEGAPLASPAGHRLQLRGGYRLHGMAGEAPARQALEEVKYTHVGHVLMGTIQYLYRDRATAAFGFAQGFRAPNLQEAVMLGDSGKQFHVPNDELQPERSDTFELLGRVRFGRLVLSLAGYASMLEDLLVRVPASYQGQTEIDGKPVLRHINADSGLLWGTEGGIGLDLGLGWSAHSQLSYVWGEVELDGGGSEPASRIPPLFGVSSLRYDRALRARWKGFLETYVRWALKQHRLSARDEDDARIPDGGTPGWWTWSWRAGLNDDGHYQLALVVENLLDVEYKYHGSGLFAPGLNAVVSYEARF